MKISQHCCSNKRFQKLLKPHYSYSKLQQNHQEQSSSKNAGTKKKKSISYHFSYLLLLLPVISQYKKKNQKNRTCPPRDNASISMETESLESAISFSLFLTSVYIQNKQSIIFPWPSSLLSHQNDGYLRFFLFINRRLVCRTKND